MKTYLFVILLFGFASHAETILYSNNFSSLNDYRDLEYVHGTWSLVDDQGFGQDSRGTQIRGRARGGYALAIKRDIKLPPVYFIQTRTDYGSDPRWELNYVRPYLLFNYRDGLNYKFVSLKSPRFIWRHQSVDGTARMCEVGEVVNGHWRVLKEFVCVKPIPNQVYRCEYSDRCDSHDLSHRVRGWLADLKRKHLSVKVEENRAMIFIEGEFKGAVSFRHPLRQKGVGFLVQSNPRLDYSVKFDYLNIVY